MGLLPVHNAFKRVNLMCSIIMPAARAKGVSNVRNLIRLGFLFAICLSAIAGAATDAAAEQRLALVVGQGAYPTGQLPTTVNDAGLIAQTLTGAGFEVIQGRDLNATDLRRVVRDFLDKAQVAEPDAAVVVYLSGYGIQLEGENYLPARRRPHRARGRCAARGIQAVGSCPVAGRCAGPDPHRHRRYGAGLPAPVHRRAHRQGARPDGAAGWFSPGLLVRAEHPGYRPERLLQCLCDGSRRDDSPAGRSGRGRVRSHPPAHPRGDERNADALACRQSDSAFVFFEPDETASAEPPVQQPVQEHRIDAVSPEEAYSIAVERDTIQDYQEFLRRYSGHPLARRVTAILAARREALVWRRTLNRNSSEAYWTYLRRYQNGPHAPDARRRLARLSAPIAPPPSFEEVIYDDLPPPLPDVENFEVVESVTILRDSPPPPPAPVYLLPERDYDDDYVVSVVSEPPPPPMMVGVLPVPMAMPIPMRARAPRTFYQPIAPITPSGPVAIQVAPPPVMPARPPGVPGGPRVRPPRPSAGQPTLPGQPGMLAPAQPIPVAAVPAAPAGAPRPAGAPPRLPSRPIPLQTQGFVPPGGGAQPQPQPAPPVAAFPRPVAPPPAGPAAPPLPASAAAHPSGAGPGRAARRDPRVGGASAGAARSRSRATGSSRRAGPDCPADRRTAPRPAVSWSPSSRRGSDRPAARPSEPAAPRSHFGAAGPDCTESAPRSGSRAAAWRDPRRHAARSGPSGPAAARSTASECLPVELRWSGASGRAPATDQTGSTRGARACSSRPAARAPGPAASGAAAPCPPGATAGPADRAAASCADARPIGAAATSCAHARPNGAASAARSARDAATACADGATTSAGSDGAAAASRAARDASGPRAGAGSDDAAATDARTRGPAPSGSRWAGRAAGGTAGLWSPGRASVSLTLLPPRSRSMERAALAPNDPRRLGWKWTHRT